jgi:DNA-binding Lrp family transcriptional regulator
MPQAFILVDILPGHEHFVQERLRRLLPSIKFAHQVTGEHDLIAFLDAEPYEELAVTVAAIRRIEGVRDTETLLVLS